jgi:hypothetical protein
MGMVVTEPRYKVVNNMSSLIGLIEIGSPGQTVDMQLDTTFSGVLVQSTFEGPAIDGSPVYNCSASTSCAMIVRVDNHDIPIQEYKLGDDVVAWANPGIETFNLGGVLYSGIGFGQLHDYDLMNSGQNFPFGEASGVIGFNTNSFQDSGQLSLMSAIRDQVTGKLLINAPR